MACASDKPLWAHFYRTNILSSNIKCSANAKTTTSRTNRICSRQCSRRLFRFSRLLLARSVYLSLVRYSLSATDNSRSRSFCLHGHKLPPFKRATLTNANHRSDIVIGRRIHYGSAAFDRPFVQRTGGDDGDYFLRLAFPLNLS